MLIALIVLEHCGRQRKRQMQLCWTRAEHV